MLPTVNFIFSRTKSYFRNTCAVASTNFKSGLWSIMEVGCRIACFITAFSLCISVHAQNLLLNGSFEDGGGSYDGWTISHYGQPPFYGPWIGDGGVDGAYYARFWFEPEGNDIISQTLATVPGVTYDISFSAEDGGGHNFVARFSFGDFSTDIMQPLETGPGTIQSGWMDFDFTFTATADETDLSFLIGADTGSEFGVDNVSVVAAPPTNTCSNVSFCRDADGTVHSTWKGATGKTYRVEVSSNLVNWTALTNLTATNADGCFEICEMPPRNWPQRFYRAVGP